MTDAFGIVARNHLTCGMHVHVSIATRAEGVAVLDRIRPWLPSTARLIGELAILARRRHELCQLPTRGVGTLANRRADRTIR